jgi:MYXO-CTERM domain-containing protein
LVAFAAVIAVAPGTARALTCGINTVSTFPLNHQDVPTNTLLWGYSAGRTRLLGPSGEVVPTEERALVIGGYQSTRWTIPVLVPGSVLQPNARYTIEIDAEGDPSITRLEFLTGNGPASAAPRLPELVATQPHVGTFWASFTPARWLDLQFQNIASDGLILIGDPGASENDPLSSVTSLEDILIDGPPSAEAIAQAPMVQWIADYDYLSVGITDCALWPDGAPDTLTTRFATLDVAGNFSGWTDIPIELPSAAEAQAVADEQAQLNAQVAAEDARIRAENLAKLEAASQGGGCAVSASRASGSSGLVALALVLIGWARRRNGSPAH